MKINQEQLEVISSVCKSLCQRFAFGEYDSDDIFQESFIICVEDIMPKYDGESPLENFLRISLPNRLLNFRRKNYPMYQFRCSECDNEDSENCYICLRNRVNHLAKKNLHSPINLEEAKDNALFYEVESEWENNEMFNLIDINLPTELREDYLKMLSNVYVSKNRREEVVEKIREILLQFGFMEEPPCVQED